ncbi:MAG TPA: response regulator transcription factor [Mariniphaga anaerophila]|uniref:Response regulator transcription factor n=1 Tax=Mariniphaga anaerophila TaxID=1484053 RepID=A0A831PIW2_9BACT|nr:response regulator transcription factor [Mariniphaga anaerophila]
MKLLIIEYNMDLALVKKDYLSAEGYSCVVAPTREKSDENELNLPKNSKFFQNCDFILSEK